MPSPNPDPESDSADSNPYQTPNTQQETKQPLVWPVPLVIAICMWPLLTFKVFFAGMMLSTWALEFDISLNLSSQILIHPMMLLFVLTATAFILFSALTLKQPSQRRNLGRIACVLGLIILVFALVGLILPMLQLAASLS